MKCEGYSGSCAIKTTVPVSILQGETVDCALVVPKGSLLIDTDEEVPSRPIVLPVSDIIFTTDGTKIELH